MIRLYLGCDACGSKTYEDIGTKYKCSKSSCTSKTSTSVARMIFQFDLVDIIGSWNVTLFSDDKFGCADGFDFTCQHEWWSLMVFGYFVKAEDHIGRVYSGSAKHKCEAHIGRVYSGSTKHKQEVIIVYKKSAQLYKQQAQKLKSILAPSTYLAAATSTSTLTLATMVMMNFMEFLEQIANKPPIRLHSYKNMASTEMKKTKTEDIVSGTAILEQDDAKGTIPIDEVPIRSRQ
ncbi:hypothetical protein Cgig2_011060 [Carnegiea gigantea]|uniref:Uncharacterized protein n=1 Tax=Carnegiea gigantea TaxID=171969 RepID=A0A9Q1GQM4_9CARY|nr:hypothetical protein Cgig2_011060 [Carnegiea gigantea]